MNIELNGEIKEQYEKHEKFVWRDLFSFLPQKTENNGEGRSRWWER